MIDRAFNLILQEVDSGESLVRSYRVLTCRWQDTVRLLKVVNGLREVTRQTAKVAEVAKARSVDRGISTLDCKLDGRLRVASSALKIRLD
jgi:hypothetical protein